MDDELRRILEEGEELYRRWLLTTGGSVEEQKAEARAVAFVTKNKALLAMLSVAYEDCKYALVISNLRDGIEYCALVSNIKQQLGGTGELL